MDVGTADDLKTKGREVLETAEEKTKNGMRGLQVWIGRGPFLGWVRARSGED